MCTLRGPGQWKVTVRGKEGGVSGVRVFLHPQSRWVGRGSWPSPLTALGKAALSTTVKLARPWRIRECFVTLEARTVLSRTSKSLTSVLK